MLDSAENTSGRPSILEKMKKAREEQKNQDWDAKILAFLKEKSTQGGSSKVNLEKKGKTLIYSFGDKKVILEMHLTDIRVGESGGSFYLTMSTEDYENNPWFQEAYKANPVDLRLT